MNQGVNDSGWGSLPRAPRKRGTDDPPPSSVSAWGIAGSGEVSWDNATMQVPSHEPAKDTSSSSLTQSKGQGRESTSSNWWDQDTNQSNATGWNSPPQTVRGWVSPEPPTKDDSKKSKDGDASLKTSTMTYAWSGSTQRSTSTTRAPVDFSNPWGSPTEQTSTSSRRDDPFPDPPVSSSRDKGKGKSISIETSAWGSSASTNLSTTGFGWGSPSSPTEKRQGAAVTTFPAESAVPALLSPWEEPSGPHKMIPQKLSVPTSAARSANSSSRDALQSPTVSTISWQPTFDLKDWGISDVKEPTSPSSAVNPLIKTGRAKDYFEYVRSIYMFVRNLLIAFSYVFRIEFSKLVSIYT